MKAFLLAAALLVFLVHDTDGLFQICDLDQDCPDGACCKNIIGFRECIDKGSEEGAECGTRWSCDNCVNGLTCGEDNKCTNTPVPPPEQAPQE